MSGVPGLLADLAAEEEDLDRILAAMNAADWGLPTPSPGWDVRDQITHLAFVEELAREAVAQPETFAGTAAKAARDSRRFEQEELDRGRRMDGPSVLEWWRRERMAALDAMRATDPTARVPWFGPSMSLRSFVTARLMETWAHGQDVADTLGVARRPSERLRHIAHLGISTRGWSYAVRGLAPPTSPVLVELEGPDGAQWAWGEAADDRIQGPALDFCLVVTQRRRPDETRLRATGAAAVEWLDVAQAFAGPPTRRPAAADERS